MEYPGIDGFLGTRASIMLDVVVLAMFAVLPILGWSVFLARVKRNYLLHKRVQLALGVVLAAAVTLFELDMRLNGWEARAVKSPGDEIAAAVTCSLYIHLFFAVTTAVLWIYVTAAALRCFANPPSPGDHSRSHIFWARLAAWDMVATAVTGWAFYWLAFV